ncbi:MAG TPA: winged helix-turn-helix domain-containing protein [Blastocatellia bacterium]|nr:winged helix-turn-helix domain-containing protein [Blastocatellia bacterium]
MPIFTFNSFLLDTRKRLLYHNGEPVSLTPKAFATLVYLIQHRGRVIEKKELMDVVWPEAFVEEVGLARNISVLRKALGENANGNKFIVTYPGQGYSFVAEVQEQQEGESTKIPEEKSSETVLPPAQSPEMRAPLTDRLRNGFRSKQKVLLFSGFLVVIVIALGWYKLAERNKTPATSHPMEISRFTTTGQAFSPTISRDGKYVAFTLIEGGQHSLWVRQVTAGSRGVQIIPPSKAWYLGASFSPDGNYLYYVMKEGRERSDAELTLYQIPALGGIPKKLITGVNSIVTFSPDGSRLAFVRNFPDQDESALMIAHADGTGEQKVAVRKEPEWLYSPAWSPDGEKIACIGWRKGADDGYADVIEVQIAGGTQKSLTSQRWAAIDQAWWLADGHSLVIAAREKKESPFQLWQLAYPSGEVQRITNDLNEYRGVSLSADSTLLAAQQFMTDSHIWVITDPDSRRAQQLTAGVSRQDGMNGLAWTPDGKIIYSSSASGKREIWSMNPDGSQQRQLTMDSSQTNNLSVSPNGRYIVFVANPANKMNIWRVNIDGSQPKQLSAGNGDFAPYCSPDNQWVFYHTFDAGKRVVWKVPIDGGEPIRVPNLPLNTLRLSPDGKLAAHFHPDAQANVKMGIIKAENGQPVKTIDLPPTTERIQWAPDGQALIYCDTRARVTNVWSQSLAGGQPRQLTHFDSGLIPFFAVSRDGQQIACVRRVTTSDVVLIRDFRRN